MKDAAGGEQAYGLARFGNFLRDRALLLIIALAILLRTVTAYSMPGIAFADEAFQYVEQAYRLLTGRGQVPWEYVVGVRSWFLPLMALPPVAIGRAISSAPEVWWGCVTAMMIALSATTVAGAYVIGRRAGSRSHGLWAAFLSAIWCESIYYSPHFLADSLGAVFLVATLAVAASTATHKRALLLGALLGATFIIRMQLGPALGAVAVAYVWRAPRALIVAIFTGALVPLAAAGLLDWATWGAPFKSLWTYFHVNRLGVADSFGTKPAAYYLIRMGEVWTWLAVPILLAAILGARRAPLLLVVAILTVAAFSAVPHKEYRFVYPAVVVIFILAGIGVAELVSDLGRMTGRPRAVLASLIAAWALLSIAGAASPETRLLWLQGNGTWRAMTTINDDPQGCGVAVWPSDAWSRVPRSRLRDDLPLFRVANGNSAAFDYVLVYGSVQPVLGPQLHKVECYPFDDLCVWRRPGPCESAAGAPLRPDPPAKTIAVLRALFPSSEAAP